MNSKYFLAMLVVTTLAWSVTLAEQQSTQPAAGGKGPGMGYDYRRNMGGPGMGRGAQPGEAPPMPAPDQSLQTPPQAMPGYRGYPGWAPGPGTAAPYVRPMPGYMRPGRQGYGYPGYRGQGGSPYPGHRQYGNPPAIPPGTTNGQ